MHELGFEFTHFAEFAWAQLEPEEGRYDFAWLDKAVALAAKYDLKVIMCTSTATPPVWMSRKYPEILLKNEDGTVLDHGARQHASFASPLYRELSYKMIEKLAQHYAMIPVLSDGNSTMNLPYSSTIIRKRNRLSVIISVQNTITTFSC